jgi:hypothetical protein
MEQDSVKYDSIDARPLPKWLTDQRDGLNKYQPEVIVMKDDRSLSTSMAITGAFIIIALFILTLIVLRKNRKNRDNPL